MVFTHNRRSTHINDSLIKKTSKSTLISRTQPNFLEALVFQAELADGPGRPTLGLPIGSIMHRYLDESTGDSCFG